MYRRIALAAGLFAGAGLFASPALTQRYGGGGSPAEQISGGLSDLFRSAGQSYNRPSQALIDRETARSMNYDNQIKYTKTFFEKRRLNRMYRAEERGPRGTHKDFVRRSKMTSPDRLSANELDSIEGSISWPIALKTDEYAAYRHKLDGLYASHAAAGGGINTPEYAEIESTAKEMQDTLRENAKDTNPQQYVYARKFLESFRFEAAKPAGT